MLVATFFETELRKRTSSCREILLWVMIEFLCNQDYYQVNTKGYLRKLFFSDDPREFLNNALHFYNEIHYEVSPCCI